jgi:AraC family transcriptional regulator, melibiose operon regulatory protein
LTVSDPLGRPDRQFYAKSRAFGRFGMRWFTPVVMAQPHSHGHIEMNWLTAGAMDYAIEGRRIIVPSNRLTLFWAGIPHQTVAIDRGPSQDSEQCNIYLPLDAFLHMPHLGNLPEVMMGGGIICLDADSLGQDSLRRWYGDYRSGDPERQDILKTEIAAMLRRAVLLGWEELLSPWIEASGDKRRQAQPVQHVVGMVRHILENLSEPLAVEDVARAVQLHPNYALNLFTSVMHVPIHKFVVRMRLVRARQLLFESRMSIANVAFNSGFSSLSQFYAHFNRAYGVTPLELRTQLIPEEKGI